MSTADRKSMKADVRPVLGPDRDHLDSWKEIAAYLGREVRTAQRWERREGLPIHRHSHVKGSSVWAFRHEIDAWRCSRDRAASEAAPKEECSEAAESLNSTLFAAARMPAKSRLLLRNAAAGVGSLDLLAGEHRIRLYFYVQLRAEQDADVSLKNLTNRGRSVN
jgi:phage terminase Nu1 subunit (DNA packaging protein)